MPKIKAKWNEKENEVIRRLKAGNGKISGLQMLAAVDDLAMIPVEVVGIDYFSTKSGYQSGISVHVKPVGGHGSLWIAPGELIDNKPEAIDLFERKCKASAASRAVTGANSDRVRRGLILDIREKMSPKQKAEFAEKLPDRAGEAAKEDVVKAINKMNGEWELRRVGELAAKILYSVDEAPEWND